MCMSYAPDALLCTCWYLSDYAHYYESLLYDSLFLLGIILYIKVSQDFQVVTISVFTA